MATDTDDRTYTTEVVEVAGRAAARRRLRIRIWLLAGIAAAGLTATWAAGVVTSTTTLGSVTEPTPVLVNPGGNPPSKWDAVMDEHSALAIGFSGAWGTIPADAGMFDVDLTGTGFTTGEYYVTVVVLNTPNGWERLQLQFLAFSSSCATVNWATATPISTAVLYVETDDARVNLTEMGGGGQYCVGVRAAAKANDPATTYIRRPSSSTVPTMPVFAATVGQSS